MEGGGNSRGEESDLEAAPQTRREAGNARPRAVGFGRRGERQMEKALMM